jgi:hypothetical protein
VDVLHRCRATASCATGKEEVHRALLGGVLSFLSSVCTSDDVIAALSHA